METQEKELVMILFFKTPEHVPLSSFLMDKAQWHLSLLELEEISIYGSESGSVWIVHVELFMGQMFLFLTSDWI